MKQTRQLIFSITLIVLMVSSLVFQVTPAKAGVSLGTVLILDTTLSGTVESTLAAELGYTVEIVTAAQWGAKSTADFATYRALILGDSICDNQSIYAAALANRTTWSPAVTGNIMLIGGDPGYHANNGPIDPAKKEIKQSIAFAADQVGHTGLYFAFGCAWQVGGDVNVLDQFGTFTMRGAGVDDVHKVANHPALDGLDDATLSNWSVSTHAGFTVFPVGWTPVAIMDDLAGDGNLTFPDGHNGVPYMLGKGEGLVGLGPNISNIVPRLGPTAGGTVVTITGTLLAGATAITFGGASVNLTLCTTLTDTSIVCPTPAHAAGLVDVVVTAAAGTGTATNAFRYVPPPTFSNIGPNVGPDAGSQSVVLTGANFMDAGLYGYSVSSVTLAGIGMTCNVDSNTQITCTNATPPNPAAPGPDLASIVITTPGGSVTGTNVYLYLPPPTVTAVSQDLGPTTGGTPDVLTGTHFMGTVGSISWTTSLVTFGGTPVAGCVVDSATQITCSVPGTPAHVAGTVSVAVTTPGGTSVPNTLFTYVKASDLGVEPNYGPTAGGTTVILRGHGFTGTTGFTFGGTAAICTVNTDILITCTTPAHAAGLVPVVLSGGPSGTRTYYDAFTFVPPAETGVTPSTGPTGGGTTVTITGTDFTAGSGATFGGTAGICTFVNATTLSCVTPPHAAGTVDVVVTGPGARTFASAFTFISPQFYADLYPNFGPVTGGTIVTITGKGFTGATVITFGGTNAASFVVNSDTVITAVTPAHAVGLVDVIVTRPGGALNYPSSFTFTASNLPLAPDSIPTNSAILLETDNINQVKITFNMAMLNVGSGDPNWAFSALNPANYLLVSSGPNGVFDTQTVLAGARTDDRNFVINTVTYDPATFTATLNVNFGVPLPQGQYLLFASGTGSLKNMAGVKLNGGLDDTRFNFTINPPLPLPATGFAPNRVTALPAQTVSYAAMGDLWLEIPKLGVQMNIVGIPQSADGSWDVSWLGKDAGWLNGSAFPTWAGNSVLTGHVWNANNTAGPFAYLNQLWYGDQIIIHAWGAQYVYEVRAVKQVSAGNSPAMLKHEELPWVTLMTCRGYDAASGTYQYRLLVRAVLVTVK